MKRKNIFNFLDPTQIMSVVVSLIILGVGVFAFFTVVDTTEDNVGTTSSYSGTFSVTDPSVDKDCDTSRSDLTNATITVEQYNGFDWVEISSSGWDYSGTTVTVNSSYMED